MSGAYELYRRSTLGVTLTDALDDLVQQGTLSPHLAMLVLYQFDKSMSQALAERVRNKISMKGHLRTYQFCDEVWTFVTENVRLRLETGDTYDVPRMKIVACKAGDTS